MSPLVEPFDPIAATHSDLAAWTVIFTVGQGELSGGAPRAEDLAVRLRSPRFGCGSPVLQDREETPPLILPDPRRPEKHGEVL